MSKESLQGYVRRVRGEKHLSLVDVARRSKHHGSDGISDGYISRIENGYILQVGPKKLSALARGLGVPEDDVYAVQRGLSLEDPSAQQKRLWNFFNSLPKERQDDLMRIAQMLHREYGLQQEPRQAESVARIKRAS